MIRLEIDVIRVYGNAITGPAFTSHPRLFPVVIIHGLSLLLHRRNISRDASSMKPLGIDSSPKGGFTVRFNIALGVIDTFAVALRLAARWRTKAKFAVDDWWIVWSLTPQYGMIALTIIGMFHQISLSYVLH